MRQQDQPITPEYIEIARWTASLGAITAEALAHRMGVSVNSARGRLGALQRRGLLLRKRPLAGRPPLYSITRAGLRACDARGIRMSKVETSNANHLIVCAAVAAALERSCPHHCIVGERELTRDEHNRERPLVKTRLRPRHGQESPLHSPDLVLWSREPDGGLPLVVEVELTVKGHDRLVEICRAWTRSRTVAGVLYFAPADVQRALLRAIAEVRAGERIVVMPIDSLLRADTLRTATQQEDF